MAAADLIPPVTGGASIRAIVRAKPTEMKLLKRIGVSNFCYCVASHNNQLYVGVDGGVDLISKQSQLFRITSVEEKVYSIDFDNNNMMYTLSKQRQQWDIEVYDSMHKRIASWKHSEKGSTSYANSLLVVQDSVFVPDRDSKVIVEYSLDGREKSRLQCPTLQNTDVAMCKTSLTDVVILKNGGTLSKMNIRTGGSDWINSRITSSVGNCRDAADRVFIAYGGMNENMETNIYDGGTGK